MKPAGAARASGSTVATASAGAPAAERPLAEDLSATEVAELTGYDAVTVYNAWHVGELTANPLELQEGDLPAELGVRELARLAGRARTSVNKAIHDEPPRLAASRREDGSWRVERGEAYRFIVASHAARPRFNSDEVCRWAQAKRAAAEMRRSRDLTCDGCGKPLTRPPSRIGERNYCQPSCYRADDPRCSSGWKAELFAATPPCGSPTCNDPACTVPAFRCHAAGCTREARIASVSKRASRWIEGQPTLFCSRQCAARMLNDLNPARRELRRLLAPADRRDLRAVADAIQRSPQIVAKHARQLGVGRRVAGTAKGGGAFVFTAEDVARLRDRRDEVTLATYRDHDRFDDWYVRRFGRSIDWTRKRAAALKVWGKLAPAVAEAKGRKSGRPGPSPEAVERVLDLRDLGRSQMQISIATGLSRRQVRWVLETKAGQNPPAPLR